MTEEKLRLDKQVSHFVLTVGSTANQNGTALYEGLTVLFIAQVFGVELTIAQQVLVVLMSILAGLVPQEFLRFTTACRIGAAIDPGARRRDRDHHGRRPLAGHVAHDSERCRRHRRSHLC